MISPNCNISATTQRKLDAFDNWCLRRILKIPWSAHITNQEVRERTQIPPVSNLIRSRRLQLFGHIARAPEAQDHTRALNACLAPPSSWKGRRGRPRHTWLRTIEEDLKQFNYGLYTARQGCLATARDNGYVYDTPWMMMSPDILVKLYK